MIPYAEPCQGPNHGNLDALPKGQRLWTPGNAISVQQKLPDGQMTQNLFCTADCMCDWHGVYAAYQQDKGMEIPGTFRLIWISPVASTTHTYEDFEAFTAKISSYQIRMMAYQDRLEQAENSINETDIT